MTVDTNMSDEKDTNMSDENIKTAEGIKALYKHPPSTKPYLLQLFNLFPLLEQIMIWGYTPSFNDGDVCNHYGYTAIKYDGKYISSEMNDILNVDLSKMVEFGKKDTGPFYDLDTTGIGDEGTLAKPWSPEVKALTEALWAMQFRFKDEYGTNTAMLFQREVDGSVKIYWAGFEADY
jgi:hypothetical protein